MAWRQGLIIGLLILLGLPSALAQPGDFVADYVIKKGPLTVGQARRELRHSSDGRGGIYRAESNTSGIAAALFPEQVVETTRFVWHEDNLRPLEYTYRRQGRKNRHISQHFDWQNQQVISTVDGKRYELELPPGTLDQNSYQLALMLEAGSSRTRKHYPIVLRKKIKNFEITFSEAETIDTVLGPLTTIRIERRSKRETTILWCAPKFHYLPVRIEHEEKGSAFTAELSALSGFQQ